MIRPGPRLVASFGALAAVAAGALGLGPLVVPALGAGPARWGTGAVVAGVALALAALAAIEARRLGRWTPRFERPAAAVLPLGEVESLEAALLLPGAPAGGVAVEVRQRWPALLAPADGFRAERLEAARPRHLEWRVEAIERGSARVEPPWVRLVGRGWAERLVEAEPAAGTAADQEITVLPNTRAVGRMHSRLDRLFLRGLGARPSARVGKGRDFERLREYVPGDDVRDMEWKASARRGKWILREYRLDRSQDILLCVDRGYRMAVRVAGGRLSRLDHATDASVMMASIARRMEDRVGCLAFADGVDRGLVQRRGTAHLRALTGWAAGLVAEERHSDYLALASHVRRRLRSRALVLIFTALPELGDEEALVRAVGLLAPRHLPLVVTFADPDLEAAARLRPADHAQLCRTLVARDLWQGRRRTLAELRRRGALVVEARPGEVAVAAVNAYLDVKRRQLL